MKSRLYAVPITDEPVVLWADAMITRASADGMFVLWKTSDYSVGVEIKRMTDLERLKAYAACRARIEWQTARTLSPTHS